MIEISAADTYKNQECANALFGRWDTRNTGFSEALIEYVDEVNVDKRWTHKEGKLQAIWSDVLDPWVPFDREAVLSYKNVKESGLGRKFSEVERALSLLETIADRPGRRGDSWAKPSGGGRELDQIAIDGEGNLVLIEIKDASTSAGSAAIFYAPLQLLQYVHEWRHAFGWLSVSKDLQKLIEARQEVGLMPSGLPELTGGIRAAVCFGEDKRSDEVKRRFYEALGVVNAHLPPNVRPIETWSYGKDGPQPL